MMNWKLRILGPGATALLVASMVGACDDAEDARGEAGGSSGSSGTGGSGGTGASGGSGASAAKAGAGATKGGNGGAGGSKAGGSGTSGGKGGGGGGTTSGAGTTSAAGTLSDGGEQNGNGTAPVDLGTAENYVILAKAAISTVPTSAVTGNLGVSPAAATFITGFSLTADSTNVFSTSTQVTGKVYAANYTSPTPSNLTTAVGDMELAFTDAAGRAPDVTELGAGDIGGMTLSPGVYQWGTGLLIPTNVTLTGNSNAVWIFQVAQDLTVGSATSVILSGGALPQHVFWQVSGQVTLGTTAHFEGVVLTQTAVTLSTGASLNGRLLAQTAVSLDGNAVVEPGR